MGKLYAFEIQVLNHKVRSAYNPLQLLSQIYRYLKSIRWGQMFTKGNLKIIKYKIFVLFRLNSQFAIAVHSRYRNCYTYEIKTIIYDKAVVTFKTLHTFHICSILTFSQTCKYGINRLNPKS